MIELVSWACFWNFFCHLWFWFLLYRLRLVFNLDFLVVFNIFSFEWISLQILSENEVRNILASFWGYIKVCLCKLVRSSFYAIQKTILVNLTFQTRLGFLYLTLCLLNNTTSLSLLLQSQIFSFIHLCSKNKKGEFYEIYLWWL